MEKLEDDDFLSDTYNEAKEIFFAAAEKYAIATNKEKISLFKNRSFDKDYLVPEIKVKI